MVWAPVPSSSSVVLPSHWPPSDHAMQRPARWVSGPDPDLKVLIPSCERHALGLAIDHLNWAIRRRRCDDSEWTWHDHAAALPCRSQTILVILCSRTVISGRRSDPDPIIAPDASSADGRACGRRLPLVRRQSPDAVLDDYRRRLHFLVGGAVA